VLDPFRERSSLGTTVIGMSNYSQCRAFLINAFLTLDGDSPEDQRLRRAIELLLEAVARTEKDAPRSNVVQFPSRPQMPDELPVRRPRR
jgi:hypothetical protein